MYGNIQRGAAFRCYPFASVKRISCIAGTAPRVSFLSARRQLTAMVNKTFCCTDFSALIRSRMRELKPFSSHISLREGEVVYRMDEPANALFQIEKGRAKVVRISEKGQEKIVGFYSTGEIFGEFCVCDLIRRRDQAVAVEPLELTAVHVNGLLKLIGQKPEFSQEFLRLICTRLSDCQEQVATLSFDTTARRLAKELMKLGASEEGQGSDGARVTTGLTHEDLANLIGTTREVVTALMNQFRERGLIEYSRRRIVVFPKQVANYLDQKAR